jgi:hypothetical protein
MEDEATPSVILKYKTRKLAEIAMASGKNYSDRVLQLSWYNQGTPEKDQIESQYEVEEEAVDDYTPPQHDYLPPGLQEHEDSLGSPAAGAGDVSATGASLLDDDLDNEEGLEEEEELNHDLLDDDEDDEQDDDKGWKRRSNQDED